MLLLTVAALGVALASLAQVATARNAYVADYEAETVSAIDLSVPSLIGSPIPTGSESGPFSLAITPDGKTVWVVDYDGGTLKSLDTSTNQFIGTPIPIKTGSYGFAITPDGSRAYVANAGSTTLEAIDLATRTRIGDPIEVGEVPVAVAITPDGGRAYVSVAESVTVVDLATNRAVASIPTGNGPYTSAITPDGRFLFVPHDDGVSVIDTSSNQVVGPTIAIGEKGAEGVAINPAGTRAYVVGETPNELTVLDVATRQPVAAPLPIPAEMEFLAVTPDGKRLLIEQDEPGQLSFLDTATNQLVGPPVIYGERDGQVAAVPDQSPGAALSFKGRARPGVPYSLDGTGSADSDGTVAGWAWDFGDEKTAAETKPVVSHSFKKPGKYQVTLKVTDNEGCSGALVFTGQTASCNSSAASTVTKTVKVAYPAVKVRCPADSGAPCKFKLRAVQHKSGKKLKPLSAVAKGKAKPGKKATIAFRPKKKFAKKLAAAKKILVEQTISVAGGPHATAAVIVGRLRVVK
jgi:YVTN family beta-propeller protein